MEGFPIVQTHSVIEERKIIYEWKIHDFFWITQIVFKNRANSTIQSPVFFSPYNEPGYSSWYLKIDLEQIWRFQESLPIILGYCGCHQKLRAQYSICIIDDEENKRFQQKGTKILKNWEEFSISEFVDVTKLWFERDTLLPDDTLTISLKITDFIVRSNTSLPITKFRFKKPKQTADRLVAFFHSKEDSDVVLVVGDERIPAHKILLMSQSPVFSTMFTQNLNDNRENEVDIPDMEPDTCKKLLEFIYTDTVTDLDKVSERLYEVADKYQLPALKELCEESFCKSVSVENAVKYLVLLDLHNADEEVLNCVVDFIAINSKIITGTEEYKALLNTNPALLLTVLTKICSIK
ncbi:speckle-type POZ protein-like [Microplitis mediator]|uniref:speckle-type POZ protein-like n=1 Tax=Microplitis mediator TaxID=375433 RepID=UPI002553EC77|nr:speckle-type POZ protein-like [Microplitis mediator]